MTKLLFRCSNEHFGRKNFLKNSSSVFFQILSETFPNFRQKFYGEIVKTVFYMIGNLFEETYFFNFLLFLLHIRILGKSSLTFGRKFSAMLLNLQFTCSDEHSDEKMILKIVFFPSLSKFFPDFLQKIFCKNGRSAF